MHEQASEGAVGASLGTQGFRDLGVVNSKLHTVPCCIKGPVWSTLFDLGSTALFVVIMECPFSNCLVRMYAKARERAMWLAISITQTVLSSLVLAP